MICSLIILADRGGLKAYEVTATPTRGPRLHLIDDFEITGSERELPFNVESSRRHVTLTSDWPALETETQRRICKQLADRIAKVVETKRAEGWSFAAEPSIHKAIIDLLPVAIRDRIVEHVPSDLVKIEPAKLRSHFRSLQPIRSSGIADVAAKVKRPPPRRGLVLRNSAKR
jgi:Protein required for attachment to host cells